MKNDMFCSVWYRRMVGVGSVVTVILELWGHYDTKSV